MHNLSPPLFFTLKERLIFFVFLCLILCLTLGFKFYQFHILKSQNNPQITAQVLLQYTKSKQNKTYFVLKLKSNFGTFYTTSREDLRDLKYRFLSLRVILDKVSFWEFLRGFYAPSFNLILLPFEDFRKPLREAILNQHATKLMGEYYLTLFLSDSLPQEWRTLAQSYGISHIFAISGFHTGILSAIGFLILGFFYKPLHQRFFPYRNILFDLGFLVVLGLIAYYFLLTQSPSYLRALAMSCVAFFLLWRGFNVLRMESLLWCIFVLVAFFPQLIFSIGFYFSSLGVLYISLFFKYFKIPQNTKGKILYSLALNASTFFLMGIVVYYFFPYFSPLSLFSLLLTPLFIFYYPLELLLHLFGFGGFLDSLLLAWVGFKTHTITLQPNLIAFILCNALSLLAIFYYHAFWILLTINLVYYSYGIYLYFYGI
ncbi:ComEC/Rec2 family competence protein [Helicobacter sp. UBA3407]|uniref:ComEC/Rec2 family competence protein n=2 Tax=Helicobacter TaxID=209 RepID=UPI00263A2EA5|nr:ComEC/Rec2 family competence protein [Helicobacter sp. UBA3407]